MSRRRHFQVQREMLLVVLQMHNKLLELLDTGRIHRETESFSTDPRSALRRLKVNPSSRVCHHTPEVEHLSFCLLLAKFKRYDCFR